MAIDSSLRLTFINGENLIRCSDKEIYFLSTSCLSQNDYKKMFTCENKYNSIDELFLRLQWHKFSLVCTEKHEFAWEKIEIIKESNQPLPVGLFQVQHEVNDLSHEIHQLSLHSNQENLRFESKNIPIKDLVTDSSRKTIYLRFLHQPMLCRIQFSSRKGACSSKANFANDSEFACYYNPSSKLEPSIEIMEAEFKQLETITSFDQSGASKLQLLKPNVINEYFTYSNEQQRAKLKSKSIFLAIIILLICLVAIITIVLLQFITKTKPNQRLPSPVKLEKGISQISALTMNDSIQSIGNNDGDDVDDERPTILAQKINRNKQQQQRPGITMNFEEDE